MRGADLPRCHWPGAEGVAAAVPRVARRRVGIGRGVVRDRGLLAADGTFTADGAALHQDIEDTTDQRAMAPWEHLGAEGCDRLLELGRPLSKLVVENGGVPDPLKRELDAIAIENRCYCVENGVVGGVVGGQRLRTRPSAGLAPRRGRWRRRPGRHRRDGTSSRCAAPRGHRPDPGPLRSGRITSVSPADAPRAPSA